MKTDTTRALPRFLRLLGIDETPMGLFYTGKKPDEGLAPAVGDLPTREKEKKNAVDWQQVFGQFSCAMGHLWRARRKGTAAYFSADHFGCPGGAFWMGFNKPQAETIIHYVSTGIPNWTEGELYCDSPEALRRMFNQIDPRPAPRRYCVIKPVTAFVNDEIPELVIFFARPESLCGLHQLATFVTNDPEVVASPWAAACGSLAAWPLHYLSKGKHRAVIGGWDPSARKYFKTDELSFTVSLQMFEEMLDRHEDSFMSRSNWQTVRKKIRRSKKAWNERDGT